MKILRVQSVIKGLADLSINLASGWLGVLLISPGFLAVPAQRYVEITIANLPPAILAFTVGLFLIERSENT